MNCADSLIASALLELDHLIVAAADLDSGTRWIEDQLGVKLAPGGKHAAMGTHNRLLRLGEMLYLEVIAIDPAASPAGRPRWFDLDAPTMQVRLAEKPQLIHWVARSNDIDTDALRAGFACADILSMARGDYRWRITVPRDVHLPGAGLLPSLIQWDVPGHPAQNLPDSGCRLMKLEAYTTRAAEHRASLAALGLSAVIDIQSVEKGEAPEWLAYLKTPRGLIELSGDLPD
jgi:hypothetical protein